MKRLSLRAGVAPLVCFVLCTFGVAQHALGTIIIDTTTGGSGSLFDDDGVGDTAGPFTDPDPLMGKTFNFTTRAIVGDTQINSVSTGLGVGSSGDSFDAGESWTFDFDFLMAFEGISFSGMSGAEQMSLQSPAFVGLALTPGDAEVAFDSGTGTFTFSDGNTGDSFTLADMSGGVQLLIPVGVDLTLANVSGSVGLDELSLSTVIPEPSSLLLAGLGLLAFCCRRRKRDS